MILAEKIAPEIKLNLHLKINYKFFVFQVFLKIAVEIKFHMFQVFFREKLSFRYMGVRRGEPTRPVHGCAL